MYYQKLLSSPSQLSVGMNAFYTLHSRTRTRTITVISTQVFLVFSTARNSTQKIRVHDTGFHFGNETSNATSLYVSVFLTRVFGTRTSRNNPFLDGALVYGEQMVT